MQVSSDDVRTLMVSPPLRPVALSVGWGFSVDVTDDEDEALVERQYFTVDSRDAVDMLISLLTKRTN